MNGYLALVSLRKRRIALGGSVKPLANGRAGLTGFFHARRLRLTSVDWMPDRPFPRHLAEGIGGLPCLP